MKNFFLFLKDFFLILLLYLLAAIAISLIVRCLLTNLC
jgi:hypothetical protein